MTSPVSAWLSISSKSCDEVSAHVTRLAEHRRFPHAPESHLSYLLCKRTNGLDPWLWRDFVTVSKNGVGGADRRAAVADITTDFRAACVFGGRGDFNPLQLMEKLKCVNWQTSISRIINGLWQVADM